MFSHCCMNNWIWQKKMERQQKKVQAWEEENLQSWINNIFYGNGWNETRAKNKEKGYKCFVISGWVKIEKQKHRTRIESALKRGIKFEIMNFT